MIFKGKRIIDKTVTPSKLLETYYKEGDDIIAGDIITNNLHVNNINDLDISNFTGRDTPISEESLYKLNLTNPGDYEEFVFGKVKVRITKKDTTTLVASVTSDIEVNATIIQRNTGEYSIQATRKDYVFNSNKTEITIPAGSYLFTEMFVASEDHVCIIKIGSNTNHSDCWLDFTYKNR